MLGLEPTTYRSKGDRNLWPKSPKNQAFSAICTLQTAFASPCDRNSLLAQNREESEPLASADVDARKFCGRTAEGSGRGVCRAVGACGCLLCLDAEIARALLTGNLGRQRLALQAQ